MGSPRRPARSPTVTMAVAEAFVAADAEALRWGELAGRNPAAVASLPLQTVPGTAVVRSKWPLLEIWRLRDLPDDVLAAPRAHERKESRS